jgi:hypothetical protein
MDGIGTRAYNFVTNKIQSAVVSVPTGEDFTVFQVNGAKAKNKLTLEGGVSLYVHADTRQPAGQPGCMGRITDIYYSYFGYKPAATFFDEQAEGHELP